ncbi:hypothetical protein [Lentzea sp. NBRC 105346]|uniref:hypothetical protein n=1 Tax=Lentzea sp. NBRC 105346 TaxID=3032205 RepID=UPI002554F2C1|nr:hypothetical protein [Lentzea sp. NBRC 105346]
MSLRALADRLAREHPDMHVSYATLARTHNGRQWPPWRNVQAYVLACGMNPRAWREQKYARYETLLARANSWVDAPATHVGWSTLAQRHLVS